MEWLEESCYFYILETKDSVYKPKGWCLRLDSLEAVTETKSCLQKVYMEVCSVDSPARK